MVLGGFTGEILSYLHLNMKSSFLLIHGSGFAYMRNLGLGYD